MKIKIIEDYNLEEEQGSRQARKNLITKEKFKTLLNNKEISVEFPEGTILHHLNDDRKDSDGTKSNEWDNVIIIPSLKGQKQYANMVHNIITQYQISSHTKRISQFFDDILNLELYYYDNPSDTIIKRTVFEFLDGGGRIV